MIRQALQAVSSSIPQFGRGVRNQEEFEKIKLMVNDNFGLNVSERMIPENTGVVEESRIPVYNFFKTYIESYLDSRQMQKAARKMPDKMRGDVFTLFYCRTAKAADKIVSELNELFGRYDILHVRKTGDTQVISHYRSLRQN